MKLLPNIFRFALASIVVIALVSWSPSIFSQTPKPKDSFLLDFGAKGGADHLMVLVKDLRSTTENFRRLGFNINPWGQFPEGGLENAVMYFENETFLEFLAVYDKGKASGSPEAKFLEKYEGASGYAVEVASAAATAQALQDRGSSVAAPEPFPASDTGDTGSENWYWKSFGFRTAPPGGLFLIEYNRTLFEKFEKVNPEKAKAKITHANTAVAVTSVWIAVRDLEAARAAYSRVGLANGESIRFPELRSTGYKIGAGKAAILLLKAKNGPVHQFIAARDQGIMGVTIRVAKMAEFRKRLPQSWSKQLKNYGKRKLIIPGELTNGLWIEVTE